MTATRHGNQASFKPGCASAHVTFQMLIDIVLHRAQGGSYDHFASKQVPFCVILQEIISSEQN
jgi:hypothetical protein